MKTATITIAYIGLILSLVSCAERVDPVNNTAETALKVISISPTPGWTQDVWVNGNTAFVADGEQWVGIWDVSQLESPVQIDTLQTLRAVSGVYYSPATDLIMVDMPSAQGGITYYDLSDKTRINTVFDAGLEGWGFREISSDTIIVAEVDRSEGFKVFVIFYDTLESEWIDTEIRGIFQIPYGTARGLHYEGDYGYIAHNQFGLKIVEVTISALAVDIVELGNTDTPGGARDVALNGDKTHAIIADYQAGISIVDIADKSNPEFVTSLLPDGVDKMTEVFAVGDTVYAIDNDNGIFAFDVTKPAEPRIIGRYDSPTPRGMFVSDDHTVYLADEDIGLIILGW